MNFLGESELSLSCRTVPRIVSCASSPQLCQAAFLSVRQLAATDYKNCESTIKLTRELKAEKKIT